MGRIPFWPKRRVLGADLVSAAEPHRFVSISPGEAPIRDIHNLLLGGVAPRPIALVSTVSKAGEHNLAPFSFFNAFGANPPYVAFSPAFSGRDGLAKDTLVNLKEVPECVIHAVPYALVEQVSLASTAYARGVDEFVKAGFSALESELVQPRRVAESPFQMECRVEQIIPLGGQKASGNLVLCQVLKFHVAERVYQNGTIDPDLIDLVGRNSANFYTRASGEALFALNKPSGLGIGIDALPEHIRHSEILSANDLGKLGGLPSLPGQEEIRGFMEAEDPLKMIPPSSSVADANAYVRMFVNGLAQRSSHSEQAGQQIEQSAKLALARDDREFAIRALLTISLI